MRKLLKGASVGILFSTGILSYVYFTSPLPESIVKEVVNTKEITVSEAKSFLEDKGYVVKEKKDDVPQKEEVKSETVKEKKTEPKDEKKVTPAKPKVKEYKLVISKGMDSQAVTNLLYENGILKNNKDFEGYLRKGGLSRIIQTGTYSINDQMSFSEIAKVITKQ